MDDLRPAAVCLAMLLGAAGAAWADETVEPPAARPMSREDLQRSSPTLRRWISDPPDLLNDIENGQAFPTRLGIGLIFTPSRSGEAAYTVSLQDVVLGGTRLSFSGDFTRSGTSNQMWGAEARYYVAPLGSYLNVAPQVGYRNIVIDGTTRNGLEAGAKFLFALAPRAADIAVSQSWVLPDRGGSIGRTVLEVGYTLSPILRLTAVVQWINSTLRSDTSFGINFELIGF